jgi:hypothetical protein
MNATMCNKLVLSGTLNQTIQRENSFTPSLLRFELKKPSGVLKRETPLTLVLHLALLRGYIENVESNLLNLGASCTLSGGSDTRYLNGYKNTNSKICLARDSIIFANNHGQSG